MKVQIVSIFALLVILTLNVASADLKADEITSIPGWPSPIPFKVYAGYLNVSNNGSLYYVMTESQSPNPAGDPVILWLNGGPGCSSLMGLLTEIGPYVFEDGQTQLNGTLNPYAWNKRANIIYLEGPAGVGFSQGNVSNRTYDDDSTANDHFTALVEFFNHIPALVGQRFYIAGESYAGIYIPNLAVKIDDYNSKLPLNDTTRINLQGIIVGNGVANRSSLLVTPYDFFYAHGQISQTIYDLYNANCRYSQSYMGCDFVQNAIDEALLDVNPYSIYRECMSSPAGTSSTKYGYSYAPWSKFRNEKNLGSSIIPCVQSEGVYNYLNNQTVQQALNVQGPQVNWDSCSDAIFARYNRTGDGSVSKYQTLISKNLYKITVYSGDTDGVVPTIDTMNWVYGLNLNITTDYSPWYYDGQVAGYNTQFNGLNFTTVKGAGHMVPQWNRGQSFLMIDSFLNSTALPTDPLASWL